MSNENKDVTWKVVACCACAVLWSILFWKMTTMSDNVDNMMRDMAVVKHVLGIDSHTTYRKDPAGEDFFNFGK